MGRLIGGRCLWRQWSCHASIRAISRSITICRYNFKELSDPFPKAYVPRNVESGWVEWWEKQELVNKAVAISSMESNERPYSMVLPPPNVTGFLHLGHAFTVAIEDAILRWHRMKGHQVMWVPGFDHAGIAAQVVVERKIWAESQILRSEMGKVAFLEAMWAWTNEKRTVIRQQLHKLGASLDWSKEAFTMSTAFSAAVAEAFVRLYEAQLISRQLRLVNWSCNLQSAIADIEVENMPVKGGTCLTIPGYKEAVEVGKLAVVAYEVEGGGEILVATTRPETMFGDVAIAVHPDDPRYHDLIGRKVFHPLLDHTIPIIADHLVDREFMTGAMKVTPAHDNQDYEIGKKHQLSIISVIDEKGLMTHHCGQLKGLPRFEARKVVLSMLKDGGRLRDHVDHDTTVPICIRSGDIVEPLLKPQWYLDCTEMANFAMEAVRDGRLSIMPKVFETDWFQWLNNIKPWCISRQLWWGHRIPAYKVTFKDESYKNRDDVWVAAGDAGEALRKACQKYRVAEESIEVCQDEDVLDTWFSSALFPLAAFNWPQKNQNLEQFFPLALMETGHDILFFWVARMVMLCHNLSGQLPFHKVLVHGLLTDVKGRKMSKSLGNVIDPMDVIFGASLQHLQERTEQSFKQGYISKAEKQTAMQNQKTQFSNGIPECGADALRFALCCQNIQTHTISIDIQKIHSVQLFGNKLWQSCRFYLQSLEKAGRRPILQLMQIEDHLSLLDRWLLSRIAYMVSECETQFPLFNLHFVTFALQQFWYSEFCDIYVEGVKESFQNEKQAQVVCSILHHAIRVGLIATSPFMPFLCEELFQRLFAGNDDLRPTTIMCQKFPANEDWQKWRDLNTEETIHFIMAIVKVIRRIKLDYKATSHIPDVYLPRERCHSSEISLEIKRIIGILSKCNARDYSDDLPLNCIERIADDNAVLHLHFKELPSLDIELHRIASKLSKLKSQVNDLKHVKIPEDNNLIRAHAEKQTKMKLSVLTKEIENLNNLYKEMDRINKSQK